MNNEIKIKDLETIIYMAALSSGPESWKEGIVVPIPIRMPEQFFNSITEFCESFNMDRMEFIEGFISDLILSGLQRKSAEFMVKESSEGGSTDMFSKIMKSIKTKEN